jgi:rhodanese-related sulfurtransferase
MRWILYTLLALVAVLVLWDPFWRLLGVPQLFPWELQRMLREDPEGVCLVDVRTPWEYRWFHIPGAANVPALGEGDPAGACGPDQRVVVICMTGHRSQFTARSMAEGFGRAPANLVWGMVGWRLFGGETVSGTDAGSPGGEWKESGLSGIADGGGRIIFSACPRDPSF